MDEYLRTEVHDEFVKRMEDEHKRTSKRISDLEAADKQFNGLVLSVERLATNMQRMLEEQKEQGRRLKELESKDGEMWRKVIGHVITAAVGLVVGYLFQQIGM